MQGGVCVVHHAPLTVVGQHQDLPSMFGKSSSWFYESSMVKLPRIVSRFLICIKKMVKSRTEAQLYFTFNHLQSEM